MKLSRPQLQALGRMMDGEYHDGDGVTQSGMTLQALDKMGLIRSAGNSDSYLGDQWRITDKGMLATRGQV